MPNSDTRVFHSQLTESRGNPINNAILTSSFNSPYAQTFHCDMRGSRILVSGTHPGQVQQSEITHSGISSLFQLFSQNTGILCLPKKRL